MEPLLLVEDKNELRAMLRKALERAGYAVDEAPDGTVAIQKVRARRYLVVITDLKMPGASGLDVLRETKHADASIPVILLTAFGSVEEAVTAMKEGAFDFLQKPVDLDQLKLLVQRAARQQELLRENLLLREEFAARYGFPRIVGEHAAIREVSQQIQRIAATDSTALLLGESGTGKELFARAIHYLSPRREQPFVALNCAAIPEGLGRAKSGRWIWRTAGHSFWMRLASCRWRFKRSCCACSRSGGSNAWAERSRLKWTCASWWRPTAICRSRCERNCFARICTSGFPRYPSPFRRCATAETMCCCSRSIFSRNSAASLAKRGWSFPQI